MSTKRNLFILSVIILISACRKDDKIVESNTPKEIVDPAMYETEISMSSNFQTIGDTRGGEYEGVQSRYSWTTNYKLTDGQFIENELFYPIQKKWAVIGNVYDTSFEPTKVLSNWKKNQEWVNTGQFYRYDAPTKKAYIYNGIDDTNPKLIMDFDLELYEDWTFDTIVGLSLNVRRKIDIVSNGNTYPALIVTFRNPTTHGKLNTSNSFVLLTPMNPNPIMFAEHIKNIQHPEWDVFKSGQETEPTEDWLPYRYWQENIGYSSPSRLHWTAGKIEYYYLPYSENGTAIFNN